MVTTLLTVRAPKLRKYATLVSLECHSRVTILYSLYTYRPWERLAYIFIYFYHRTLSALPHEELPALEPGRRYRISARFMAPGHETPRARRGVAPRAGGRNPRPSGDVCAEPLRLEGSPETQGIPSSGAGPSQNGTCSGGSIGKKSRARRSAANYSRFGRTRVCITPVSLHRVEECVISGQYRSKQSYHDASQSGTCLGGGIGSKIRAGKSVG